MRKLIPLASLLLVATFLLIPTTTDGQEKAGGKKDNITKEDATPQDYVYLVQAKEIVGKIVAVDVKAGTMTFAIEYQHWEPNKQNNQPGKGKGKGDPNQNLLKMQQQLQRDYQQAMMAKNPVEKQQALMRLQKDLQKMQQQAGPQGAQTLQSMFHIVKTHKEFDLEVMEGVKVARSFTETKYDDKGDIIKFTDEQLKQMRSADIPGAYTGKPEEVAVGQGVKIYVVAPKSGGATKGKDAPTGEKGVAAGSKLARPQVRMILITQESTMPEPKGKDKKKK